MNEVPPGSLFTVDGYPKIETCSIDERIIDTSVLFLWKYSRCGTVMLDRAVHSNEYTHINKEAGVFLPEHELLQVGSLRCQHCYNLTIDEK